MIKAVYDAWKKIGGSPSSQLRFWESVVGGEEIWEEVI